MQKTFVDRHFQNTFQTISEDYWRFSKQFRNFSNIIKALQIENMELNHKDANVDGNVTKQ